MPREEPSVKDSGALYFPCMGHRAPATLKIIRSNCYRVDVWDPVRKRRASSLL